MCSFFVVQRNIFFFELKKKTYDKMTNFAHFMG